MIFADYEFYKSIASHFGDISISLDEMQELVDPITDGVNKVAGAFEDNKTKLKTAKENFSDVAKAVQETADSFKNNDLEQNVEGFAKQLDNFINGAQEVNSAIYDTSALETLFASDGEIDAEDQKILDRFNEFGGTVADKIERIRSEIQQITQTAIDENRNLLESELENIQRLYDEIAQMTAQQEDVKTSAIWERLKNGAYTYDSYAELAEQIKAAQEQAEKSRRETEQASYEDIMYKAADMRSKGVAESEIEAMKEAAFKKISESMNELEMQSKRYEREIILAWTQGAFTDMAKSYTHDTDELKKMQQYFELMLTNPGGMDREAVGSLFSGVKMNSCDVELFNRSMTMFDDIKKQFGLDFVGEWERLNDEIGDSVFTLDDFYDALSSAMDDVTVLSVEDILPSIEEFKKQPELYDEVLAEWARVSNYIVTISGEFDSKAFDEYWDKYISEKRTQLFSPAPSNYVQQTGSTAIDSEMRLNIHLYKDESELAEERAFVGPRKPNFDLYVNNGK